MNKKIFSFIHSRPENRTLSRHGRDSALAEHGAPGVWRLSIPLQETAGFNPWSFILVLVCVAAGIYFRFYAFSLPALDVIARQEVQKEEFGVINKFVDENYPDMSSVVKGKMAERLMKDDLRQNKYLIASKIDRHRQELKKRFCDERGFIYINGVDSYYWLRLLENLISKGHVGDRVVDGVEYDDFIGAPIDSASNKNVHIWLGYIFYKIASLFNPNIPVSGALFYVPIFLSVIIGVFTFFVARNLGANEMGAFFASVAINLSPFLMERSVGEWFDTDIYNVLFPLLVFGVFVFCFKNRNIMRQLVLVCLSAIFLACYASTWKGWWFIFDIMIMTYLFFILNLKLAFSDPVINIGADQKKAWLCAWRIKDHFILLSAFFFISSFFVISINGFGVWKDFIAQPLCLWKVLKVTSMTMWPNVYQTVAELKNIQSFELMTMMGGAFVFFSALLGLLYLYLIEGGSRDERYGFGILTIIFWVISVFCVTLQAFRFALLLVVPIGLAFGLSFSTIYKLIEKKSKDCPRKWMPVALRFSVVIIFSVYLLFNISTIHAKLLPVLPQMTDEWHDVLVKIKNETPKDAIIDSWWDFGHWFKEVACRRVLFDGMTQNTPYAFWTAGVLLTDNEQEAVGILRMINSSDNKAIGLLEKQKGVDLVKSILLVREAAVKNTAKEACDYLTQAGIAGLVAREVTDFLFPAKLPAVYLIISYDMIAKIGAISYIGNWDFQKVDMWFKHRELTKDDFLSYLITRYGLTPPQAQNTDMEISLLDEDEAKVWFSNGLYHVSLLSKIKKRDNKLLFFENGLVVDLANDHAYVLSEFEEKAGTPEYLFYMRDGIFMENVQEKPDKKFSALLISDGESYQSMLTSALFARSMLARLYFFKGAGLNSFKLFAQSHDKDGNAIYCYEIKWPEELKGQNSPPQSGKVPPSAEKAKIVSHNAK